MAKRLSSLSDLSPFTSKNALCAVFGKAWVFHPGAARHRQKGKSRKRLPHTRFCSKIIRNVFEENFNLSMNDVILLGALAAFTLALNLPFGLLRSRTEKYSLRWFLCIHLPIPFIYLLRRYLMFTASAIPLLVVAAVLGQIGGGKLSAQKKD